LRRFTGPVMDRNGQPLARLWTFLDITDMKRLQAESAARHGVLVETLSGLETVRATGAEARMQTAWERSVAATARSGEDVHFWSSLSLTSANVAQQVTSLALLVIGVFLILDGNAVVRPPGKRVVKLGMGDFFGELALIDNSPRSATVEAQNEVLLARIASKDFLKMLNKEPKVSLVLLRTLAARLRASEASHRH